MDSLQMHELHAHGVKTLSSNTACLAACVANAMLNCWAFHEPFCARFVLLARAHLVRVNSSLIAVHTTRDPYVHP